ncbi:MAG TPA: glycosyltransferase family A protein [Gaiellaceae bacterium]|nr:glycosyltransferase family A protein [Gaiellaceae bacterium]
MTVPSFSVVLPVYDAADTVAEAVESALDQTVPPLEIIVVDDGSTDDLDRSLEPYRGRIGLVRQENGGCAAAFNAGLWRARGDFVAQLDADDAFEPERLAALGELAAGRPDLDLVMTDTFLEAGGRVVGRYCEETPFAVEDQRLAILRQCFVFFPAIRREVLVAAGGHDETLRLGPDWDCYLRLILAGSRAGLVDEPLYRYRISSQSLTGDRAAALAYRVRVLEKAASNPDLRVEERPHLRRSLDYHRRRALLAEAEAALRAGDSGARHATLALVRARGVGGRTRLKALAATVAPRWAGRRLEARAAGTGESHLTRRHAR